MITRREFIGAGAVIGIGTAALVKMASGQSEVRIKVPSQIIYLSNIEFHTYGVRIDNPEWWSILKQGGSDVWVKALKEESPDILKSLEVEAFELEDDGVTVIRYPEFNNYVVELMKNQGIFAHSTTSGRRGDGSESSFGEFFAHQVQQLVIDGKNPEASPYSIVPKILEVEKMGMVNQGLSWYWKVPQGKNIDNGSRVLMDVISVLPGDEIDMYKAYTDYMNIELTPEGKVEGWYALPVAHGDGQPINFVLCACNVFCPE